MIRFAFVDDFPSTGGGWYAHYDHRPPPSPEWRDCDARAVIGVHERRWIDDFDRWHAALCAAAARRTDWWWLTPASRPNLWAQSASLKPLVMAAAVHEWSIQHPDVDRLAVIAAPRAMRAYLEEFTGVAPTAAADRRAALQGLRPWAGQVRALLRQCFPAKRPSKEDAVDVLFYSHLFFPGHGTGDHFFGDLAARVAAAGPTVATTYYVDGRARESDVRTRLAGRRSAASLVGEALNTRDVVAAAIDSVRVLAALRGIGRELGGIRLGARESRTFVATYLAEQLWRRPPVMELAIHRAFARVLDRARPRTVVYPYEQKALERGLLRACLSSASRPKTVGYAHPLHTEAHLALRSRAASDARPAEPDTVLATGPAARDFLTSWGRKDPDAVISVGSHRHRAALPARRSAADRAAELRVLVITGHGFELSVLSNLVARRSDVFGSADVQIRPTGGGWFREQAAGIYRLRALSTRIRVGTDPLAAQLDWCDIALFSSTTAGVETMLARRAAVYVALHDVFTADPTLGSDAIFGRCADADGLAEALARARSICDAEFEAALDRQQALAERLIAPVDEAALVKALGG